MNIFKVSPSILFAMMLGTALIMGSCEKEDSAVLIDSMIVGKWETTTFQVSGCEREGEDVELRDCGFSEGDDVECGIQEFRADGRVVEDGQALENALDYAIDGNVLTLTDPVDNERYTFRFEASDDAMTWDAEDFNGVGCSLTVNFVRVK